MYILYEGASLLDGKPIVVIGIPKSSNTKTGGMFQTIIMRSDIDPITASRQGEDFSVCGNCVHRGVPHDGDSGGAKKRSCYVMLLMVLSLLTAYEQCKVKRVEGDEAIADLGDGLVIRLGSYGDTAAGAR